MKLFFDIFFSFIVLVILSPVLFIVYIIIFIYMGSPVFFKQVRPGQNGYSFTFYKFRTMTQKNNAMGELLHDKNRITKVGSFLRKTSLDELPSLWNVIKGDMSLVGPRPLLMEYLDRYSSEQARRHEVKPGITGWAQVNGRNAISWEEKFKLDVWYVDNQSLWLDVKILIMTIWKVLKGKGITQKGYATVEYFKGNKNVQ